MRSSRRRQHVRRIAGRIYDKGHPLWPMGHYKNLLVWEYRGVGVYLSLHGELVYATCWRGRLLEGLPTCFRTFAEAAVYLGEAMDKTLKARLDALLAPPPASGPSADAHDDAWESAYPCLHALMVATEGPKGTRRNTASLSLFTEDSMWKGCLNDRQNGRSFFASARSVDQLLAVIEAALQAPEGPPWRKSTWVKGGKGR